MYSNMSSKKKELCKKREEISSRYRHLQYAQEDYDRDKGKGSFSKKFPVAKKLMDSLLDEKTKIAVQLASKPHEEEEKEEAPQHTVPVI